MQQSYTPEFKKKISKEFEFLKDKFLPSKVRKFANKAVIGSACAIIIFASIIIGGGMSK